MELSQLGHQGLSADQKKVIASTSAGFSLENMDIMFLSFAMTPIIAQLHISSGAAGLIGSITNLGMLVGGVLFGFLGDRFGRVKTFFTHSDYFRNCDGIDVFC